MSHGKTNVVLAHGAWADGSSWGKVIERLNRQGIEAVAAPLPLTSLGDDVAALERTLERIDGPVVLAGHAYAGAVIGATRAANVAALVYVAALAPDEGESVADVFHRGNAHPQAPQLAPDRHGWIWLPQEAFANAFAQHATAQEAAALAAIQRPIAAACIGEAVGRPLWRDRPAWFLVAGEDRMIDPDTQRFMASRMNAQVRAHEVDHAPSVTAPDVTTQVIAEAVGSVSSR
ncbi:alpha/beta hydrolase [Paraburkholderia sp. J76]|uniref:alpha/beta hydrolase n=1 Tax=Paraburkholderia sp. J76 TaxID=2805439 RepID=UPI002ABE24DF|nr:alpha/beta hydrolase [Paraburkholderia sp. J76]